MNEPVSMPDVVLHANPLRVFLETAWGIVVGVTIGVLIANWIISQYSSNSVPLLPQIVIMAGIPLFFLAINSRKCDVTLSGTTLRAPIRKGWWLTPVEVDLSEIDLPASQISRLGGSFLKTQDGRSLLINHHPKKDIERLFEEVRKRIVCRNHG